MDAERENCAFRHGLALKIQADAGGYPEVVPAGRVR
jgi:hypothetical protein